MIRAQGNVSYVRLPTRVQLLGTASLILFVGWTGYSSLKLIGRDAELDAKNARIEEMRRAYGGLTGEVSDLRSQLLDRAERLEERQRFLERVLGTDPVVLQDQPATPIEAGLETEVAPQPGTAPQSEIGDDAEPDTAPAAGGGSIVPRTKPRPPADGGTLSRLFGGTDAHAATGLERDPSDRLQQEVSAKLERIERAQLFQANEIVRKARGRIDEIMGIIASTGTPTDRLMELTTQQMAAAGRGVPSPGVGGPLIEADGPASALPEVLGGGATGSATPSRDQGGQALRAAFDARQHLETVLNAVAGIPSAVPVKEGEYYISSGFGTRIDPFTKRRSTHYALDLAGWPGTDIFAPAPGKVVTAEKNWPYGWMVEIDHGNGFRTRYGHMRKLHVKEGQRVERLDRIGEMGSTGRSTSTHLHYEVWFDGEPRDPKPFIEAADDVFQIQKRENG
ncbi:peptidoglycan DD-metalloendopeptidase family protein [Rhodothalassium salexigens]|uniref:peptidoglycan DD-metalloendopeptidase family protein n=1 Tax=Rhodothalassium salexigens TaxID=1086 RepID=UPI001912831B|nr:peptidoglycan DD-metalloendopeptidase family protein [Rhodothalassium salexigens]